MRKIIRLLIVLFLLSACEPKKGPAVAPQAWIDTPLDGSTLLLASVDVMSHAADPGGISQFVLNVNGVLYNTAGTTGSGSLIYMHQTWDPSAPGSYILEVRAKNNAGVWSNYAQVVVTVAGGSSSPVLEPSLTPTYPSTRTPEPSPSLLPPPPKFVLIINANCRIGPGVVYDILDTVLAGAELPIEGVNQAYSWWYVRLPNGSLCWVSMTMGTSSGNIKDVHVLPDPATPTPTETQTEIPTQPGPSGCFVYNPQQQSVCTAPCPPNAQPGGACTP